MTTQISTTNIQPAALAFIQGPVVSSIQITNSSYTVLDDTAVDTAGGYIRINGVNFVAGMNVVIGSVTATSVSVVSGTVLNVQVPAQSAGTYIVYVIAPDGGVSIVVNGLTYSGIPSWVTGSTLTSGQVNAPISIQLSATGATSYALAAGSSLPAGLTLSSSGLLSGTVTGITVETLYNFTVNAIDAELQDSPRAFSITIAANDQYFDYITTLLSANTPASTFVADASANSFNVTVFGDTRPSNFGPYTPGYYSNYFDGSGDYLSINYASGSTIAGDFTWECWAYDTGATSFGTLLGWRNGGAGFSGFIIQRNNNNNVLAVMNNSALTITQTSNTYVTNQWNHVALVRSGSTVTLYVNGTSVGSGTLSGSFNPGSSYWIGSDPFNNVAAVQLQGYVSNQRFVNGTALYTSNFTPSTTPLTAIANTSLLTCQSNRFIDNSTNNFAITRNGDVTVNSFDPFVPSSSFAGYGSGFFDGTGDYLSAPSNAAFSPATGDFTIECWAYLTATTGEGTLFYINATSGINLFLNISSNWGIARSGVAVDNNFGTPPSFNTWNHLAVSRSGSTIRAFINGTQVFSGTNTSNYAQGAALIGSSLGFGTITGYISDFRMVKGTAVYTSAFTPPTTPLTAIANTSLLTLQNNQPNNNSMFLDSSTSNFNITRNGNTTQGSFSPYGGGWSNYFDGGTNRLTTGNSSQFNLSGASITLECWVYMTATPSVFNRLITIGPNNAQSSLFLGIDTGRILTISVPFGSGGTVTSGSTALALNTWSHIAFVLNGSTGTLYLNGTQVGQTSGWNITSSNSNYFYVGYDGTVTVDGKYTGYVSNVRLLVGTALYSGSSFTVPNSPLTPIANTRILTCADNRLIDDSANNFAIGVTGSVSVQRFNPFNPVLTTPTSYSGYFDGNGDYLSIASNAALSWGTGDYTVEAWVYLTSAQSRIMVVSGVGNFAFFTNSSANIVVGRVGTDELTSTGTVTLNQWVHIAATRSSNTTRIFINGTLSSTPTSITTNYGQNLTYIGSDATIMTTGYISNFRAVKGTALYTSNFTPSTTPLTAVANTSLLTLQSPTFIDNSTNNLTITNTGDTAPRQFNPFGWTSTTGGSAAYTPALYGGSAYFDGTGDFLSVPDNDAFNLTGDFTIECWLYPTSQPTAVYLIGQTNSTDYAPVLLFLSSGRPGVAVSSNGSTWTINGNVSTALTLNAWSHVALVRSGNKWSIYVNGVENVIAASTAVTPYNSTDPLGIGGEAAGTLNYPYFGYITDVRITKGTARYTSNFASPVAPLTALQNTVLLNNMTGAGIYDSSMIVDYETVGNASINTSIKKYGNTSMYFDGSGDYLVSPDGPPIEPLSANLTWEMWINTTSSTQYATLYSRTPASFATGMWSLMINVASSTAGDVALYMADFSGSSPLLLTSPLNVRDGAWHHIAVVRNGSAWTLYVDGTSRATGTWSGTIANIAGGVYIGTDQFYGRNYLGYIDDLRITNGIARYTSNFTPPSTPFINF